LSSATLEQTKKQQRTCIACRKTTNKAALIRLVCSNGGQINYDPTGKQQGRGAYVCSMQCLERAYNKKQIDRALRSSLSLHDYELLVESLSATAPNS